MIKINYAVNKKEKRKFKTKIDCFWIQGNWENDNTHKEIRAKILKDNPGYMIEGYAMAKGEIK